MGLADGHSGTFSTWAVFAWSPQYILDLLLVNLVSIDVRLGCFGINIEAKIHPLA
jgi:hypothetical protein